jgi:hypothetical protein
MRSVEELKTERENLIYLASGLYQTHQLSARYEMLNKVDAISEEIYYAEQALKEEYKKRNYRF